MRTTFTMLWLWIYSFWPMLWIDHVIDQLWPRTPSGSNHADLAYSYHDYLHGDPLNTRRDAGLRKPIT